MEHISTDKKTKIRRLEGKTAVLYIRVSSKDQVNNFSIPTQLKECRDYLKAKGITEVGLFIEQGESAKTAYRTEFQNLLSFLSKNKNKVDFLLCYKFDRFSRNTEDFHFYKSVISKYGTSVKSVTENTPDSPGGRFLETIYAGISQLDNENKGERVKACLATKALDGWYPAISPYGYKNNKETRRLVKDDRYFEHIQYCLKEFAKGETISDLTKELQKREVKTFGRRNSPRRDLTNKEVWRILCKSKFYAGVFDWKEHKDIQGKHEKMITWNEHLKIQSKLHIKPSSIVRDEKDLFVLNFTLEKGKGFLTCTNCGQRMRSCHSRGNGGVYSYYYCPNRSCTQLKKSVAQGQLESVVANGLRALAPKPPVLDLFKEVLKEECSSTNKDTSERNSCFKKRLQELENDKEETIAMRRRKELDLEDYTHEMSRIKNEIANLSLSISSEEVEESNLDTLLENAETFLKNLEPLYNAYPISKKRKLLSIVYPKGVLYGNGKCRTTQKSLLFELLDTLGTGNYQRMSVLGFEPRT